MHKLLSYYRFKSPLHRVYPGYLRRERKLILRYVGYVFLVFVAGLLVVASAGAITYRVKEKDTLYKISKETGVSQEQIRRANRLEGSNIRVGQDLVIPHDFYVVGSGEGLYKIVRESGIPLEKLLKINRLSKDDIVHSYTKLRIPVDPALQRVHVVQEIDTWEILEDLYSLSEYQMRQYTGLSKDQSLIVGMNILLAPGMIERHIVLEGETLYSLSMRYGVTVDNLMQYNALNTDVIKSGQILRLSNPMIDNISSIGLNNSVHTSFPIETKSPSKNNYSYFNPSAMYFSRQPTIASQPSAHYVEPQMMDVKSDYDEAIELYNNFKNDIATLPVLSNNLKGYKIVLDPGHGGYDPGAIGKVDINGHVYYLVEDEYVYDIALRLYAILAQHGADVELTILAPNHTIRNNEGLESFVNQKNEVYNSSSETRRPVGGRWGLKKRVEITGEFLENHSSTKSIFMSLHADSSETSGLVLTHTVYNQATKNLANHVIRQFKQGRIISDNYLVLKDNPAYAAVLVEVRSMFQDEAKHLLDSKERQKDAQRLADAILAYVKGST